MKCHDSRAKGKLVDDAAEEDCETANDGKSCVAKYFKDTTNTIGKGGCPVCIAGNVPTIAVIAEASVDVNNSMIYCASPSGAFLDGGLTY
jgi:hypothetical protein